LGARTFQTVMTPSKPPAAILEPSGDMATERTTPDVGSRNGSFRVVMW
jgi:hypothetical protein